MQEELLKRIQDAELVLVGIGEEFDGEKELRAFPDYLRAREALEQANKPWAIPALQRFYREQGPNLPSQAFHHLASLLKEKNYFLVSVSVNDGLCGSGLRQDRMVTPCGGARLKQCGQEPPVPLTPGDEAQIVSCGHTGRWEDLDLGVCPHCGQPWILNNVYTARYDERGYLDQWQSYTKWLQGTLNRRLCILELGVGLQCPGVIRFPFEKIGYYNQKTFFIRVHERLSQLTKELAGRGQSVSQNAVEWLCSPCL